MNSQSIDEQLIRVTIEEPEIELNACFEREIDTIRAVNKYAILTDE